MAIDNEIGQKERNTRNKIAMTLAGDRSDRDKVDACGISRWVDVDKKITGSAYISY
jgi:hypothetical protein